MGADDGGAARGAKLDPRSGDKGPPRTYPLLPVGTGAFVRAARIAARGCIPEYFPPINLVPVDVVLVLVMKFVKR